MRHYGVFLANAALAVCRERARYMGGEGVEMGVFGVWALLFEQVNWLFLDRRVIFIHAVVT